MPFPFITRQGIGIGGCMRETSMARHRAIRAALLACSLRAISVLSIGVADAQTGKFQVLVLNQMGAWPHTGAINEMKKRLDGLALAMDFGIRHVESKTESLMVPDTLNRYQVIVLNNNTSIGAVIRTPSARAAFQEWLKRGNGIVAVHEVSDHADLWPWFTDSLFGGARMYQHSAWNSDAGKKAKVKWDDIPVEGEVKAGKSEYGQLKAGIPGSATGDWFTYPDSWDTFTVNPRDHVDVLMRIDESSYDVPMKMGADHPIAWATHLPPLAPGSRPGRFIYTARGHEVEAFSGTGSGAAPNDVWGDPASPTYNFIRWSICWAAAASGKVDEKCDPVGTSNLSGRPQPPRISASGRSGTLDVTTRGTGRFEIGVFDGAGHRLARAEGPEGEFHFPGLKRSTLYFIRVREDGGRPQCRRFAF
jgi:hypothetical protein